jgi:polyphenol oxidase
MKGMASFPVPHEIAPGFPPGIVALTTRRQAGSYGLAGDDPVGEVLARWTKLPASFGVEVSAITCSPQVHGAAVIQHDFKSPGFLRTAPADGHFTREKGLALAVTIADCTPVFLAHESGAIAVLHAGWRGTAARIVDAALEVFRSHEIPLSEVVAHLGPSICGDCYEVGPEVHHALYGTSTAGPATVDVRSVLAQQLHARGVSKVTRSSSCTLCDNAEFFSHRAGDQGRPN